MAKPRSGAGTDEYLSAGRTTGRAVKQQSWWQGRSILGKAMRKEVGQAVVQAVAFSATCRDTSKSLSAEHLLETGKYCAPFVLISGRAALQKEVRMGFLVGWCWGRCSLRVSMTRPLKRSITEQAAGKGSYS